MVKKSGVRKVVVRSKGARAIMNDPRVQAELLARAGRIQDAANAGIMSAPDGELYQATVQAGKNRARASVVTGGYASMRDNQKRNSLLKALDRGR